MPSMTEPYTDQVQRFYPRSYSFTKTFTQANRYCIEDVIATRYGFVSVYVDSGPSNLQSKCRDQPPRASSPPLTQFEFIWDNRVYTRRYAAWYSDRQTNALARRFSLDIATQEQKRP